MLRKAEGLSRSMGGELRIGGPSFEAPLRVAPQDEVMGAAKLKAGLHEQDAPEGDPANNRTRFRF